MFVFQFELPFDHYNNITGVILATYFSYCLLENLDTSVINVQGLLQKKRPQS